MRAAAGVSGTVTETALFPTALSPPLQMLPGANRLQTASARLDQFTSPQKAHAFGNRL